MVKYEHEIGITKGTPVENYVAGNFEGETNEVGIYLAMSRQASREGYGELAEVARFCEMNGIIKPTLKENIEWMMGGEKMANAEKREASEKAAEAGIETAADFFRESSKDEGRHYKILEGILERYF